MKAIQGDLSGKRVLVTGGTGFIGGRLIERLVLECQAQVRVMVSNFARASRIARFSVDMVQGDLLKLDDVERAVSDCDIVIHCAYGNRGSNETRRLVNVEGTGHILEASLRAGVKRVIHLSTVSVYGDTPDGDLDETAPRHYSGNVYADSKLDAEKLVLDYGKEQGLPVVVIQPTIVYGPFGAGWTANILKQLKTEQIILVNAGTGLCNAVYIDDLVEAIFLAAVKDEAVGEAFLISGEQPVTWRDFYAGYERMLNISGTVSMSIAEAEAYYAGTRPETKSIFKESLNILREEPLVRERLVKTSEMILARSLMPERVRQLLIKYISGNGRGKQKQIGSKKEKPISPLPPMMIQFYSARTRIRIDKAKRILGYQPAVDLETGMNLTEQWARWANLLGRV